MKIDIVKALADGTLTSAELWASAETIRESLDQFTPAALETMHLEDRLKLYHSCIVAAEVSELRDQLGELKQLAEDILESVDRLGNEVSKSE